MSPPSLSPRAPRPVARRKPPGRLPGLLGRGGQRQHRDTAGLHARPRPPGTLGPRAIWAGMPSRGGTQGSDPEARPGLRCWLCCLPAGGPAADHLGAPGSPSRQGPQLPLGPPVPGARRCGGLYPACCPHDAPPQRTSLSPLPSGEPRVRTLCQCGFPVAAFPSSVPFPFAFWTLSGGL